MTTQGDVHREVLPHPGRHESFRKQSARVEEEPSGGEKRTTERARGSRDTMYTVMLQ